MKTENQLGKPYVSCNLISIKGVVKRLLTTRLPMTTVARKNGMQETSPTSIQSHIDSIHSPQSTRKTIMNECIKSVKFHLGRSPSGNRSTLSVQFLPNNCIPITAKMKIMMHNTNVRLPRAPTVLPMIEINRFNVGHDFASLNTLNWKQKDYYLK